MFFLNSPILPNSLPAELEIQWPSPREWQATEDAHADTNIRLLEID